MFAGFSIVIIPTEIFLFLGELIFLNIDSLSLFLSRLLHLIFVRFLSIMDIILSIQTTIWIIDQGCYCVPSIDFLVRLRRSFLGV